MARGRKVDATGRSKSDGQYLLLPYFMGKSTAFRSLSGPGLKVWIELRCCFNGSNNGKLSLSYQRAAELLGLSKTTVARAFKELSEKGFIKQRKAGQWYGRRAHEWIVLDQKYNGYPATRDWERWRPPSAKKQKSVPRRHHDEVSDPEEYRRSEFVDQHDTRHPPPG